MLRKIIVSAILLILSFPPFNIWILAWVAFIPLLFAVQNQKPIKAFLISYLTGLLFFLGTIYWLIHVTLPGMIVVVAYLALYFGLFGLIISITPPARWGPTSQVGFIPAAWVALEWLRGHALTGFGWALLGYSQSLNLPIIQIADISGAYGVSFLVMMCNVAIFIFIRDKKKKEESLVPLAMTLILIAFVIVYGVYRLNSVFTGERLNVAVVQGNIPQDEKWDRQFTDSIMSRYGALTKEAATQTTDLIIWPETSVPGFIENEKNLFDGVKDLASGLNTPLLIGAPRYEETKAGDLYYNSAYLFLKDGAVHGRYDKLHLVPFGEYVPFKYLFFFVHRFAPRPIGDFRPGKEFTVFQFFIKRGSRDQYHSLSLLKKISFSSLICFEDIFPDLAREFVKNGAFFLVNITNDAWFGRSAAAYQHAQASVFRAVENRVNVVRAANTGLSCFIDQKGRIVASVTNNGKELFEQGFKTHEIVLSRVRTLYNAYGDVFVFLCASFSFFGMVRYFRERRSER